MSKITSIVQQTSYRSSNDDGQHFDIQQNFGSDGFESRNYKSSQQTNTHQVQNTQTTHYETSNVVTRTVVTTSKRAQSGERVGARMQETLEQANQSEEFNLQGGQIFEEEGSGERISGKYNYQGYDLTKKHASHKSSDLTLNKYSFANASLKNKQFVSQTGLVQVACEKAMKAAIIKQEETANTHIGGWEMELRAGLLQEGQWQQKIKLETRQGGAAYYRLMQKGQALQQVSQQAQEPELIELACAPQDAECIQEPEQIELACCPQETEVIEKKPQQFKSENVIQIFTTTPGSHRQYSSWRQVVQPQFVQYQVQSNSMRIIQAPIQEVEIKRTPTILQGISFGSPMAFRQQVIKSEPIIQVRPASQQVIQVGFQQVVAQQQNVIHEQHQLVSQPLIIQQTVQQVQQPVIQAQNIQTVQQVSQPVIYAQNIQTVQQVSQPVIYAQNIQTQPILEKVLIQEQPITYQIPQAQQAEQNVSNQYYVQQCQYSSQQPQFYTNQYQIQTTQVVQAPYQVQKIQYINHPSYGNQLLQQQY